VHAEPILETRLTRSRVQAESVGFLAVALALIAVFGVYHETFFSMVWTWERSETFAHGFVIVPIFLFLVWRCRARLAAIEPQPFLPALVLVAALGALWLLGELASVLVVPQFAITLLIPAVLWAGFGTEFVRVLAFPLAFLLFAVPFGEAFVPKMMDWTADFTVFAIRLSGVPIFREGNRFMIPTGAWSVVEACSGIRYLIASMVVGALFAYLTYRSNLRRWAFFGLSIAVSLVANWVRAYVIVMLGHLSGNRIAVGVDHLIYGWIFFGVVIAALFWIGSKWREDDAAPATVAYRGMDGSVPRFAPRAGVLATAGGALAVALAWPALAHVLERATDFRAPILGQLKGEKGWTKTAGAAVNWLPNFDGWRALERAAFAKNGAAVGIFVGYYRSQSQGMELVSSANQFVATTDRTWNLVGRGSRDVPLDDGELAVLTGEIRSANQRIVAWQWYWVDGKWTTSDYVAKAWLAWAVLLGRGDDSAVVVIHTAQAPDGRSAEAVLESFVRDMLPAVEAVLTGARERR
jgi:exosortase A